MSKDKQIIDLQSVITSKEEELKKLKRPIAWKTNASIVIDGVRHNLNVVTEESCLSILSRVLVENDYLNKSAKILNLDREIKIFGYSYSDWEHDILLRVDVLRIKEKESKLNQMKKLLESRLSEEAKIEKDLLNISDELKNM